MTNDKSDCTRAPELRQHSRRNGRAFSSLAATGGGFPIAVSASLAGSSSKLEEFTAETLRTLSKEAYASGGNSRKTAFVVASHLVRPEISASSAPSAHSL